MTHTAATWFGDRTTASRRRPQAKDFDRRRMLALAALLPAAMSWTPRVRARASGGVVGSIVGEAVVER